MIFTIEDFAKTYSEVYDIYEPQLITEVTILAREIAVDFHKWMVDNDTEEQAENWFHFSDNDMFHHFLEHYYKK